MTANEHNDIHISGKHYSSFINHTYHRKSYSIPQLPSPIAEGQMAPSWQGAPSAWAQRTWRTQDPCSALWGLSPWELRTRRGRASRSWTGGWSARCERATSDRICGRRLRRGALLGPSRGEGRCLRRSLTMSISISAHPPTTRQISPSWPIYNQCYRLDGIVIGYRIIWQLRHRRNKLFLILYFVEFLKT